MSQFWAFFYRNFRFFHSKFLFEGNGADDVSVGNCADVQKKVQVVVDMDMKVNVGVNMNKDYNGKMIFGNDGMDMDMNKVNVVRKMECKEYVQQVKEMDMDKMDMDNMWIMWMVRNMI